MNLEQRLLFWARSTELIPEAKVMVEFQQNNNLDYQAFVSENNGYPAKLLGYYHLPCSIASEDSTQVLGLAHSVQYWWLD